MEKMNPEIKAKWVEALRSGKYKQTNSFLNASGKMCCLGVLCDLLYPEAWKGNGDVQSIIDEDQLPPPIIMREVGLPCAARRFDEPTVVNTLAEMNDGGATFSKIADFIEENL